VKRPALEDEAMSGGLTDEIIIHGCAMMNEMSRRLWPSGNPAGLSAARLQ